jgi:hypothetical protein
MAYFSVFSLIAVATIVAVNVSLLVVTTTTSKTEITQPFVIGVASDLTGSTNYSLSLELLQKGVNVFSDWGLTNVIQLGDSLESMSGNMTQQFLEVNDIFKSKNIHWYPTAGDHDVKNDWVADSPDRSDEDLYQSLLVNYLGLPVQDFPYYSFDLKQNGVTVHFISMYYGTNLGSDILWGNTYLAKIDDAQIEWLKKDLEANKDKIIVPYIHQPLWYNQGAWAEVHDLFKNYKIRTVLAGHFHYSSYMLPLDGISYIVVGSLGGSTKFGSVNVGNVRTVGLLSITSQKTEFKLWSLDESKFIPIPIREFTDKVQTTDSLLGTIAYNFVGGLALTTLPTSIYYSADNNSFVSNCTTRQEVVYKLVAGNPIVDDITYSMSIFTNTPENNAEFSFANFTEGGWTTIHNTTSADLLNSYNVAISDLGVVTLKSYGLSVMWSGKARLLDPNSFTSGTKLVLRVAVSFVSDGEVGYLYKDVSKTVTLCP